MPAHPDTIHRYFDTYGWKYEYDTATVTWHTGFRGDSSNFNIIVQLTSNWLYFAINPFVNAPRDWRVDGELQADEAIDPEQLADDKPCTARLHAHLLRLNHVINMAKFSIDGEGDVVLTVELPTENLDYSEFADGLNALSYYADAHFLDILNVAQNPNYEPALPDDEGPLEIEQDNEEPDLDMN